MPRFIQPVRRSRFKPMPVSLLLDISGCGDGGGEGADAGWEQNGWGVEVEGRWRKPNHETKDAFYFNENLGSQLGM